MRNEWLLFGFRSTAFCSRGWHAVGNSGTPIYRTVKPSWYLWRLWMSCVLLKVVSSVMTIRLQRHEPSTYLICFNFKFLIKILRDNCNCSSVSFSLWCAVLLKIHTWICWQWKRTSTKVTWLVQKLGVIARILGSSLDMWPLIFIWLCQYHCYISSGGAVDNEW